MGVHIQNEFEDRHQVCSFMWADKCWIMSHKTANPDKNEKPVEEVENEPWDPNQPVLGGQALVGRSGRKT